MLGKHVASPAKIRCAHITSIFKARFMVRSDRQSDMLLSNILRSYLLTVAADDARHKQLEHPATKVLTTEINSNSRLIQQFQPDCNTSSARGQGTSCMHVVMRMKTIDYFHGYPSSSPTCRLAVCSMLAQIPSSCSGAAGCGTAPRCRILQAVCSLLPALRTRPPQLTALQAGQRRCWRR